MKRINSHNKNTRINRGINLDNEPPIKIYKEIVENKKCIKSYFSKCFDLTVRQVPFFNIEDRKVLVVYIEGLSQKKLIEEFIISKLNSDIIKGSGSDECEIIKCKLGIQDSQVHSDIQSSVSAIASGNPVIFVDGLENSFEIDLSTPPGRSIDEPSTESVTRGPREGFTESVNENVVLIRKKIKNYNLKVEKMKMGQQTNTNVVISYLENKVNKKVLAELKSRLKKINIESVLDTNYIEEYISDSYVTIFPLIFRTEKPDIAAAKILEGKIIIIADGSPVVLSVPTLFTEFLHAGEDYYTRYSAAILNRIVRFISLLITLLLPSLYVALTTFHHELIPTNLIISIISSRRNVPFPALLENILMLLSFEIMREAGVRMPKVLGPAINIVGALVLGDAAVKAGIVGTSTVVIVAVTAITKFTIPALELEVPIVIMRFFLLLLSGYLGLTGLVFGILLISIRLVSMRSFGIPYMFPICPFSIKANRDELFRAPMKKLNKKHSGL
ncbi:spore germination protein [Clostridium tyrobutyricum]|uniref:spore germination protein n=1 Tax=Clostridium tyrobutyricum TaxID=1519 RepID=UPI001C391FB5|nr:spore germination protein [Clostridium tyrobutyricum]MBV4425128.1 spore germination protein [Clostridium tyrobutyricum]